VAIASPASPQGILTSSTDLSELQEDINQLPDQIPSGPKSPLHQSKTSLPATPPLPLASLPRPRFARLKLSIRRLSTKSTPVPISSQDPERPLLGTRTSTSTLSSPSPSSVKSEVDRDDATILLSLLAPLISRLQKLGRAIRDLDPDQVMGGTYEKFRICSEKLEGKIEWYHQSTPSSAGVDPHDLEMKTLLLDALSKKIQQERINTLLKPKIEPPLGQHTPNDNPLILHSTGVLSAERRSITPPVQPNRGIPIGTAINTGMGIGIGNLGGQDGMYPSFTHATQQIGLSNVFRLGSFQNSFLFSPSPVAVRQPATVEPFRV
jgi:hypothetical protein